MQTEFEDMCKSIDRFFFVKELKTEPDSYILEKLKGDKKIFELGEDDHKIRCWKDLCNEIEQDSKRAEFAKTLSDTYRAMMLIDFFKRVSKDEADNRNENNPQGGSDDEVHTPNNNDPEDNEEPVEKIQSCY